MALTFILIAVALTAVNVVQRRRRKALGLPRKRSAVMSQYGSRAMEAINRPYDPLHETYTGSDSVGHRHDD